MNKAINDFIRPPDLSKREQRYHFHVQMAMFSDFIFVLLYFVFFMVMEVPLLPTLCLFILIILIPLEHYLAHKRFYLQGHLIQLSIVMILVTSGVVVLGWDSGLQYILITSAVMVQFYMIGRREYKLSVTIFLILILIAFAIYSDYYEPLFLMPQPYLNIFYYFNIFVSMLIFVEMSTIVNTLQGFEEEAINSNLENEKLLHNILPVSVAAQLKQSEKKTVERFENASILFADIVNFTPLAEKFSPQQIVDILNGLFSKFDDLTEKYNIEKIKTIGDAYMVASGVPIVKNNHATSLFLFAQEILKETESFSATIGLNLQLRIGISSGSVVAGVIGKKKFSYDLWGDTVNMAARMESNGQIGKIQVSENTYQLLKEDYIFEKVSDIEIKGKGKLDVFIWSPSLI